MVFFIVKLAELKLPYAGAHQLKRQDCKATDTGDGMISAIWILLGY